MKKICYWSPHISNVATIKNVINSAISLKKFKKDKIRVKILDVIGEWEQFKDLLRTNKKLIVHYIFLAMIFSLVLCVVLSFSSSPKLASANFYLFPSRAWELFVGSEFSGC